MLIRIYIVETINKTHSIDKKQCDKKQRSRNFCRLFQSNPDIFDKRSPSGREINDTKLTVRSTHDEDYGDVVDRDRLFVRRGRWGD